ncbi:G2/mitotic-specific cyclin-B3 isoform X1 [Ursus americanus]|uniref:G2/mitotic-specific cyclin-B3 isoform X1 n=2 Tax=Ursus americanus TaxID=9643 RepID=UPI001E6799CD|nr:G2/mitotic-specific cyclin-B3 isoform X1 [Ursus americanus]
MPLPLPSRTSKPETKKSQSSKIVPSDHGQSEKEGENYQAKISSSSPKRRCKKRSAFEDLTNASQTQPAQLKKEANKEFVKDVSKKIKGSTSALGLAKNNEMNMESYKLEPSPVVVSTTLVPNIMEKPHILEVSTISKTTTTEEVSFFKKPLILKEELTTEDTSFFKRSLSLKKSTNQGEVSLMEKPPSLQEEADSNDEFVVEPMTFGKKHKTEEAAITKGTLSLKKMCTYQGDLALQDITVEEDSFLMEPTNFRKKPKTEEAAPTKKVLSLKKKNYTTQGKVSHVKKPLGLQKTTSEEESLIKEPLAFKKKPTSKEAIFTLRPLSLTKCTTNGKIADLKKPLELQKATSGEKALIKEPLSFKKKPTSKEESLFQEPSALQEKHTTDGKVVLLKKPQALQEENDSKDKFLMEPMSLRKKHTTKETDPTKKPLPVKKKSTIQGKMYHLKKPLVLHKTTSGEKSFVKEPWSSKKDTTEESLFHEPSMLQEKHTTQEEVSISKKALTFQKTLTEKESLLKEALAFKKKRTIEEATPTKKLLSLKKKKCTSQGEVSCLQKPLELQVTSGEKSLIKEPLSFENKSTTEEESLFKESPVLQEKHTTQGEVALLKNPGALQENIDGEDEFLIEPVPFRKKDTTDEAVSTKEPLSLKKKKCATQIMMSICQELLDLQNMISKDKDSFLMEPGSLRKKCSTEEAILTKTPLSLKKKQITRGKMFLLKKPLVSEKTTLEEESLFKNLLPLNKKSVTEGDILFQDPSVLKEKHTTLQEMSLSTKSLALPEKTTTEEESYHKEPLTLEEKPTTEEEFLSQEPFSLHVKPTNKDESLFWKALGLQKKTDTKEESLKKLLALQEKCTTEEESLLNKPSVLKEELSTEVATSIEKQLPSKKKPTAQGEVFVLKKHLALQENITNEESLIKQPLAFQKTSIEETIPRESLALQENPTVEEEATLSGPLALQEKPSSEKETLFQEPLSFQEKPTLNETFHVKETFALNEKPTTGKELSLKEPLALQENPTQKEHNSRKDFFILQVENSSHVFSTAPESRTGMSSVGEFNNTSESSACESSSDKPSSPWGKRSQKEIIPLEDIDKNHSDPFFNPIYAKDIFSYMKEREEKFILKKYMNRQTDISSCMRAILVDWLVEVQMTFEMSHETLYLAVKLVDHYLMEVVCKRDKLQLLGSTAFLIAAKFEESCPPCVDDFLYICDDIYQRDEMLTMEISILQTLKFDINIPIAYHFLRRYARCLRASMKTLTLSRFICEMTLQEYDYVQERASKLAAGSFLLALYMKKLGHWAPALEYYSGYKTSDLHPLVKQLNTLLTLRPCNKLKTVHSKYSHQVFFEVTKIPPLDVLKIEEILNYG